MNGRNDDSRGEVGPTMRVRILTPEFEYWGTVTGHWEAPRLHEVLNDPRPFLALTQVTLTHRGSGTREGPLPRISVHKGTITHALEEESVVSGALAPATTEDLVDTEEAGELALDPDLMASVTGELVEAGPDDFRL